MPVGGLTVVVAERGFGKTTTLRQWSEANLCAWHICSAADVTATRLARGMADALRLRVPALPTRLVPRRDGAHPTLLPAAQVSPHDYAAALAGALDASMDGPVTLVLDDVHELGADGPAVELLDALVRAAPQRLRLVLVSRLPLPFTIERLRAQGRLLEIGAADLRLSASDVEALLELVLEQTDVDLAAELHAATGGWPVVVRLAAAHLSPHPPADRVALVRRLLRVDSPLLDSLEALLLAEEPSAISGALQRLAPLRWLSAALCSAVGIDQPARTLGMFRDRGLVLDAAPPHEDGVVIAPVVRTLLLDRRPLEDGDRGQVLASAAKWFASHERYAEALGCLLDAADEEGIATLLRDHGATLLHRGEAHLLRSAVTALPGGLAEPALQVLMAQAHQQGGDWDEAQRLYDEVDDGASLPSGLAWRIGSLHYQRGNLPAAVSVFRRAILEGANSSDEALVLAWLAAALFRQGDVAACAEVTSQALQVAHRADDDIALSAAHTAAAMLAALRGDRASNDHHHLLGMDAAMRAGDVSQMVRMRTNRSANFIEQGFYRDGLAEATTAIDLAEGSGVTSFLGTSLINRGEAHRHLGNLEQALVDFEAARSWYERLGPTLVGYALQGIADVHRVRGQLTMAAGHYREAIELAERAGDHQALVPALSGLALALCREDPVAAVTHAQRAVAMGPGGGLVHALTALAAAHLAVGSPVEALQAAAVALEESGRRRDRRGMAQSLELRAEADPGHPSAMSWLEESGQLWQELESPRDAARVMLARAGRSEGAQRRMMASRAAAVFTELGIRDQVAAALEMAGEHDGTATAVGVHALGGFGVLRAGTPVPRGEWGSRKARDLLKVLVARRGRGVPREQLAQLLWPDEDPARTVSRLSVQLSTLRAVLDPTRSYPADHFVLTEGGTVRVDLSTMVVDVDRFLALAEEALAHATQGEASAPALLTRAEALYTGDFLEADVYADWATSLREEAKASYIEVVRTLAELRVRSGEPGGAARMFRRLLEHDRYDEPAHLGLVQVLAASGRHGEARRSHAAYTAAITELGIEPLPFPHPPRPA